MGRSGEKQAREKKVVMAETEEVLTLTSPATEAGTRRALTQVMEQIMARLDGQLSAERAGMVEVALAEVINNIVEHAYGGQAGGEIRLSARLDIPLLRIEVCDDGLPLPGAVIPPGRPIDLAVSRGNLPEGGFGWILIHAVASDVRYSRSGGVNRLQVTFDLTGARPRLKR